MELFYLIIFVLGISLGSFLNALEWRLHGRISIFKARSICPTCKEKIRWYDNIPLLSFVLLRRKCRHCNSLISWQYPAVELWMGFIFVFVFWFNWSVVGWFSSEIVLNWFIVWVLTFVFIYDLKYMEVLDSITLGAAIIIFIFGGFIFRNGFVSIFIGALIGGSFFLIQFLLSKGKWVGGGDIRIGILMGVILGWKLLLLAFWIAYIIGAIVSVGLLIAKKKGMKSEVAFGTFLTVATFVAMFLGQPIIDWYVGFLN